MFHLTINEMPDTRGWARALLILGLGTIAVAWLSLWVAFLRGVAGAPALFPGPLQELVVVGGALLAWWLNGSRLDERRARVLFIVAAVPVAVLTVCLAYRTWVPLDVRWIGRLLPPGPAPAHAAAWAVTAAFTLALWWVGGRIGASPLDERTGLQSFAIGVAGLFIGLVIGASISPTLPAATLGGSAAFFFAAALLSLPLAQLVTVQNRGRALGGRALALDPRWAPPVGGAALSVLVVALLLSGTISGAFISAVGAALGRLPDLILTILTPLIIAIGYLIQWLLALVQPLVGQHRSPTRPTTPHLPVPPPSTHGHHGGAHLPPVVTVVGTWVVCAVVAVVVLVALSRAIARRGGFRRDQPFEEERSSVWSRGTMARDWQNLLAASAALWRSAPHRVAQRPPRSVREAYRRLLRRGAQIGYRRAAPETPQEYLRRLRPLPLPDERDATLLTGAYMRVRYGDEPERPPDLEHVLRAWERLDNALAQLPHAGDSAAAVKDGQNGRHAPRVSGGEDEETGNR